MSQIIKETNYTLTNFDKVRIVMVNTTEPGNIGAAARAMKNMSLKQLFLVNPSNYPSAVATARASGADDVLSSAVICLFTRRSIGRHSFGYWCKCSSTQY